MSPYVRVTNASPSLRAGQPSSHHAGGSEPEEIVACFVRQQLANSVCYGLASSQRSQHLRNDNPRTANGSSLWLPRAPHRLCSCTALQCTTLWYNAWHGILRLHLSHFIQQLFTECLLCEYARKCPGTPKHTEERNQPIYRSLSPYSWSWKECPD